MIETNETEIQTVCGGVIKDPSKYPHAEYQGKQVYFCTQACLRAYNQDPDRFMTGEIEHPTDDK